jgi:hypothetical protein
VYQLLRTCCTLSSSTRTSWSSHTRGASRQHNIDRIIQPSIFCTLTRSLNTTLCVALLCHHQYLANRLITINFLLARTIHAFPPDEEPRNNTDIDLSTSAVLVDHANIHIHCSALSFAARLCHVDDMRPLAFFHSNRSASRLASTNRGVPVLLLVHIPLSLLPPLPPTIPLSEEKKA